MERLTKAQKELYDWLVKYIHTHNYAPSIRQMMQAMNLRSPAPIQSRLERLRKKGYIDWTEGKARTLRIVHKPQQGIKILGAIAAGGLVEPFTDEIEKINLSEMANQRNCYALRVTGDSMIDDLITEGDFVIMRAVRNLNLVKDGQIVAARIPNQGTTLKRLYRSGEYVILSPSNPKYDPIRVHADKMEIQGTLVGVWRGYE